MFFGEPKRNICSKSLEKFCMGIAFSHPGGYDEKAIPCGGMRGIMLNFEEELMKFQPSLEIDEAEEAIFHNDLTDFSDIIETVVKSKSER